MDIFDGFKNQDVILTPNRRLAASLMKQYQQRQIQQQKSVWETPTILPFSSWLEKQWLALNQISHEECILLTSSQEKVIWEEIIRHSPESSHLLNISATTQQAMAAWELVTHWEMDIHHPDFSTTEDSYFFQQWANQYQEKCLQYHWLDQANLIHQIHAAIIAKKISLPAKIDLIGFIDLPPAYKKLLNTCQQYGAHIDYHQPKQKHNHACSHIILENNEQELLSMARWAKALHEQENGNKKIACIIPHLDQDRNTVLRLFNEVFADQSNQFNISAGRKLTICPIIYTALQLLKLSNEAISINEISHLLRTPFFGDAEKESIKRALYDTYLRKKNIAMITLTDIIEQHKTFCDLFVTRIQNYLSLLNETPKKGLPSQWAHFFNQSLSLLGWPGERNVNSEEYQIIQNGWLPLLNDFSRLDSVMPSMTRKQALHYLWQQAQNSIFQPKTAETNIQLLGLLEATGLEFDYAWVMGLADTHWPPQPLPNAFIPIHLQKMAKMPNSSAERELAYCQMITNQLISTNQHIIFSCAKQDKDITLRPSALIKKYPLIHLDDLALSKYTAQAYELFHQKQMEYYIDTDAKQLSESETMLGGTHLFKLQALCPFKAFAELRLKANEFITPTTGLTPQERGKLIHKVLELIWSTIKDSATLHTYTDEALQTLIAQSIQTACNDTILISLKKNNSRYLSIEKNRLQKVLTKWLNEEKKRPAFTVVACEKMDETDLGPLHIQFRVDRIDELAHGEQLIIDYKTGKYNSINHWLSHRPEEPQLPFYCVIHAANTIGISYAELHPEILAFKGMSRNSLDISGIKVIEQHPDHWTEQMNTWRTTLLQLATDFYEGKASPMPKNGTETCRQCHLHSLCRINEC